MKNLENYGVQSLSTEEVKKTEGGIFGLDDALVLGIVALGITILNTDWDEVGDSISRGWNSL